LAAPASRSASRPEASTGSTPGDAGAPAGMLATLEAGQWFRSLAPELRRWLVDNAAMRQLQAGERLFARGDPPCGLYGVVRGSIRIAGISVDGKEALLTLVEPPQWFGEIALFDGLARTHDAVAEAPALLAHVPQAPLARLLDEQPALWRAFGTLLAHKLRLTFTVLEETALLPAAQRVARRLLLISADYGERVAGGRRRIPVRQEQLAMMLSLSRQTTNQILRELETQGIARLDRGAIEILDFERLRAAASID
jgi:CRP/FNR family transcriptional regulator, cyclic AMP receptor protein